MKKIFALMVVAALAATGCNDSKTSAKPATSGTVTDTKTVTVQRTSDVTKTVVQPTVTVTDTKTVQKTATVTDPKGKGPDLGGKKEGDK